MGLSFWLAGALLAALQEKARATSGRHRRFVYWGSCPDMSYELMRFLQENERQITYDAFSRNVDLSELRARNHPGLYRISRPDNWAISFYKSKLPSGRPVYYFTWSRVEHIFVDPDDRPDRRQEISLSKLALALLEGT